MLTSPTTLQIDELLEYARHLAREQKRITFSRRILLKRQIKQDLRYLNAVYHDYLAQAEEEAILPLAAEWLLDNHYLLVEQYKYIRQNLSARHFRRLPVLTSGPMKGFHRIYAILYEVLNVTGGNSDPEVLVSFIWAYQQVQPLTIGELWAIPIMLRFVIFRQLHELFEMVRQQQVPSKQEQIWFEKVAPFLKEGTLQLNKAILRLEKHMDLSNPAVLLFLEKEFRRSADLKPLLYWLDARVKAENYLLSDLKEREHNSQAFHRTLAGNYFRGLQAANLTLWEEHFEELSLVEQILRQDPARIYPEMDYDSRDLVRREVEMFGREWRLPEEKIAEKVLALARAAAKQAAEDTVKTHVGYYLLDDGWKELAQALNRKGGGLRGFRRAARAKPNLVYFPALAVCFLLIYGGLLWALSAMRSFTPLQLWVAAVLLMAPAIGGAVRLVHTVLNWVFPPQILPKIEFRHGIPREASTMVVIPTLLGSMEDVESLLRKLEVYHLANTDPHIYFALLTDFVDAAEKERPEDAPLLEAAVKGVAALNQRYPHPKGGQYFHLLHRERRYNPQEGVWMGWERKRGKLTEFNALLAGEENTSFTTITGDREFYKQIRYVITLDSDTQLPREAARRLIGTIAHPLNAPVVDKEKGIVVKGYGILQPKIVISNPSANHTLFSLLYSNQWGIDLYSSAVSNPYQDLFGHGIFAGKGIYDARIFDRLLRKRFPENAILSHDLLEGGFLRAGFVSDIELLEDYPSSFLGNLSRSHRWVRGDWQLLPWLKKSVPDQDGTETPVHLPPVTCWQMVDNLRRSLVAPTLLLFIGLCLAVFPGQAVQVLPLHWGILGLLAVDYLQRLIRTVRFGGVPLLHCLGRDLFGLVVLPYEAVMMVDAIVRTLYRMKISHRHLLEWRTASDVGKQAPNTLGRVWKKMARGQLLILAVLALFWVQSPAGLPWLAPLAILWLSAPLWVHLTAVPRRPQRRVLNAAEQSYLRENARRIWHFFETVVTAEDNWLPPDNLQVDPDNGIAHRTSPTNIGLYLASLVTARDFGYITTKQLVTRIEQTVNTLQRLPRWEGHFYNWYDTVTLQPLIPLYVSTVDSGNLLVYLLTTKAGIQEWLQQPWAKALGQGLVDTIRWEAQKKETSAAWASYFEPELDDEPTILHWYRLLKKVKDEAQEEDQELFRATVAAIDRQIEELEWFFPWLPELLAAGEDNGDDLERKLRAVKRFAEVMALAEQEVAGETEEELPALAKLLSVSRARIAEFISDGERLCAQLEALVIAHDFTPLYDRQRRLFSIGYNVSNQRLDTSFYNLLASEARQASFIAIALGQVPVKHWTSMSRTSTLVGRKPVLISWTGTAFEYLMPLLVMTCHPNTLWEQTYRLMVKSQINYGKKLGLPWGVSESGYYAFDHRLNYQYRAFGIPTLALKQGLEKERVVTPYATFLAAMVAPKEAVNNLYRMERYGAFGAFGFYEALDFTPERLPKKRNYAIVKSYMAHHQGMSFMALGNLLHGNLMHRRFLKDPRVFSTDLLLHERILAPTVVKTHQQIPRYLPSRYQREEGFDPRHFATHDTPLPVASFLSNGRYLVMVSNSGGGFSQYNDLLLTSWEEDPIKDHHGVFFYIKNINDGSTWSPTFHPLRDSADPVTMDSELDRIVFTKTRGNIQTQLKICVVPDEDAEIRQLTLTNFGDSPCTLEVTSYLEPVLARKEAFQAHPAFNKLFVETEVVPEAEALLAHRRTGQPNPSPWLVHALHVDVPTIGPLEFETDRSRFVGRGRSYRIPVVIETNQRLSGTTGAVLDPVFALRRRVQLNPGATANFTFITGVAPSREEALELVDRLASPYRFEQACELAYNRAQLELQEMKIPLHQVRLLQQMASQIFYYNYYQRTRSNALRKNVKDQSALWAYGISGDLPLILLWLEDQTGTDLAEQILRFHRYWKRKGLLTDLVILINNEEGYRQTLFEEVQRIIHSFPEPEDPERPGGVFLFSAGTIPKEDQILLETVARIVLHSDGGSIRSQLRPVVNLRRTLPQSRPVRLPMPVQANYIPTEPPEELLFFNGWGGFTPDGKEYVIQLRTKDLLPTPWCNIIANPKFGFAVSESGGGYTWAGNSREFKLTPWSNDPVLDPAGEICYLRDEETGLLWTLTALPIRDTEPYTVRHGQGYTVYEHQSQGLIQTGLVFTPIDAPVKILRLTLQNTEDREREIAVTYYLEWALGVNREKNAPFIITEYDRNSGALLARNVYQKDFRDQYGFLGIWTGGPEIDRSWTGDRAEFIGRNGSLSFPAALKRKKLSNTTGAQYNPCGAMQVKIYLPPQGERTINILVGAATSKEQVREIMHKYGRRAGVEAAFKNVRNYWADLLGRVQVATPDRAFDLLLNNWLLYQTVSCRLWARSAFYQSGGAYGYRDQLQDVLALLHARPGFARRQILLHAAHQYLEGDVQHWWHEETGYGIRTRFSDDLLWLPYAACRYAKHTGDHRIWKNRIPFLESPPLQEHELERYEQARVSAEAGTLYEHCVRAIERALRFGQHGLPLMGTGDWNDGMNMIGAGGLGESVWLGWFLYHVLQEFIPVAVKQKDTARAERYTAICNELIVALNEHGWDGQWYRRAYNDRGEPIGSITNAECQIDCIAQAWGVISGAAELDKALLAMNSLDNKLVRREEGALICLLTPPFNKTEPSPGYIQAYPQGIRENGGQYTHGTIWAVIAWALLGQGNRAYDLFRILNPINQTRTYNEVQRYRVEPYVMAADVYSVPPHTGRGGWTWYTGSAGWMYQAGLEWILGLRRHGTVLYLKPCIPEDWPGFSVRYWYGQTEYEIKVENPDRKQTGGSYLELDGGRLADVEAGIPLVNDGEKHRVLLIL
ncbi:MAG TPA: glycosyl transferase family 36 [Firmicutes bacterium]|nr:glycosyl transferase family 36 [Bacillota bacterium]